MIMIHRILTSLCFFTLCAACRAAPAAGQVEVRIFGSGGYVSTPLTWSNGQIIMKSGGVPTATTLDKAAVGLGNVENTALSTWAGTTNVTTVGTIGTGTWNATAIALGKIAQGGATTGQVLTWSGAAWEPAAGGSGLTVDTTAVSGGSVGNVFFHKTGNVLGEIATSTGGNDTDDAGKLVKFDANGALVVSNALTVSGGPSDYIQVGDDTISYTTGGFNTELVFDAPSADRGIHLPDRSGTVITDGDTGTVTNAMLAGSINLATKVTGTLPVGNGGTGITSLGTGVATALGTPSMANVNTMLSDGDFAFVGAANVFTDVQTMKSLKLNSSDGVYLRDGYEASGDAAQKGRLTWGSDGYGVSMFVAGGVVTLAKMQAGVGFGSPYFAGELIMPASHQFDFRSGTNATTTTFYNTWTSGTNYEGASIFWSSNVAHYKPVAGGGGGTVRTQRFWLTGTVWIGAGSGTPEAVETAGVGSIYTDTATGDVYRKTSGSGNTGWVTP